MQLYEKLVFIMDLTKTSNRVLAREIQVDPSLISRLRTGSRGIPRNPDHFKAMAPYFAKHCTTDYQRMALAEMLGIRPALTMKTDQLTELIYYWLCGDTDEVDRFMRTFESVYVTAEDTGPVTNPDNLSINNSIYYSNEGKRSASRAFYQHLLTLEKPCTIFLFSDETDDWILEDCDFTYSLLDWALNLLHRGFHLCHISPPVNSADQAFESLIRWIPIYMTGQVDAYYYPRIRDNVHRRTLIVAPGEIAMLSNSMAGRSSSYATILTSNPRLTQAYGMEFHDYLSMCRPLLNIYTSSYQFKQCFTQFWATNGTCIQKVTSLSAESAPPELMENCFKRTKNEDLKRLGSLYLDELQMIGKDCENHEFIDICYLASPEEVRAGSVPIALTYGMNTEPACYTPETYVLHLKNILHIMEQYDYYHFIPFEEKQKEAGIIMVKEERLALLVRISDPFTVFEITQPDITELCREHLHRIADRLGNTNSCRANTISKIKKLIRELQP